MWTVTVIRERGVGNWVPYVVALAGTEIETYGKRTRRERGGGTFPGKLPPIPDLTECPTFVLFSPPFAAHSDSGAASLVAPLFSPSLTITPQQQPATAGPKGNPCVARSSVELGLPAATDPRNSVTYFNVFPQPLVTTRRADCGGDHP